MGQTMHDYMANLLGIHVWCLVTRCLTGKVVVVSASSLVDGAIGYVTFVESKINSGLLTPLSVV